MKKLISATILSVALSTAAFADGACTAIQSGQLVYQSGHYLEGKPIATGVNPYGYNYQARSFSGSYFNSYAGGIGLPPYNGDDAAYLLANPEASAHWAWAYRSVDLTMKWNDAWLDNQDCDLDGKLDRHYGHSRYAGSGAWLTYHEAWPADAGGKEIRATDFVKIAALPADAGLGSPGGLLGEGTSYGFSGKAIGDRIWGEFSIVDYVVNDTSGHGVFLKSVAAGLGKLR